jgi:hypothetical protein
VNPFKNTRSAPGFSCRGFPKFLSQRTGLFSAKHLGRHLRWFHVSFAFHSLTDRRQARPELQITRQIHANIRGIESTWFVVLNEEFNEGANEEKNLKPAAVRSFPDIAINLFPSRLLPAAT